MATGADPWAGLTAAQRQVVGHSGGALLVVAGPGAGKTRTLTARLQHLVQSGVARPEEIVAVTFTRKAAAELRTRLTTALGPAAQAVTVGTFHRVALLLRPLPPGTALLGEGDRVLFCERALEATTAGNPARRATLATKMAQALSLLKGERSDWLAALARGECTLGGDAAARVPDFLAAAQRYQELLTAQQAEDLDDLLLQALAALRAGTAARSFRFVAVDEYQDVSGVQRELVLALGATATEVLAIGDPDQAIYAFRGAQVAHFRLFTQDFPAARTVYLRENFRSTENLVAAAAAVITHDPERAAPAALATRAAGPAITRWAAPSLLSEALLIVREVERLLGGTSLLSHDSRRATAWTGSSYGFADVAVLTRTAARADLLAAALQREGMPIQRPRRAHLDSQAALDLAAYLRLSARPTELGADIGALWRVLRWEARSAGLPDPALPQLGPRTDPGRTDARFSAVPEPTLLQLGPRTDPGEADARFAAVPEPLRTLVTNRIARVAALPLHERLGVLADQLGTPEADRLAVRAQLDQLAPHVLQLADHSHESDEWEPTQERVAVLTLHGAKGLEFPVVFLAGCEAGLLPGRGCSEAQRAEERRLFYVGLTRAQDLLYVSSLGPAGDAPDPAGERPSPFLDELPAHLVHRPAPPKRKPPKPQLKLF